MPSGAKKMGAAKRKKQEEALPKQTDGVPENYTAASVDEKAIQENNEVPLLEVASNKDNAVSKGEPLVESSENLKGNESCGVGHDLLSEALKPEEFLEKLYDLWSVVDITTRDFDKFRVHPARQSANTSTVITATPNAVADRQKTLDRLNAISY
ncbi:hypothetical protein K7X08_027291 [Anisodus acutangulus]|uniref:Uncharacterized protein n=1 Tax=Anisodus acutangulus TaxID=402998 RepID=A0A9Q1MJ31_9SOLA|nr:hypothetical protein K7X08_027291 [Anisodus acutangulus]